MAAMGSWRLMDLSVPMGSKAFYRMLPGIGLPETTRWEFPFADPSWETEIAEFVAAIREGMRPIGDAAEAVGSMSVIESVYQGAWG
jgi:hypothetical protein